MKENNEKKTWEKPVLTVLSSVEVNETVLGSSGEVIPDPDPPPPPPV